MGCGEFCFFGYLFVLKGRGGNETNHSTLILKNALKIDATSRDANFDRFQYKFSFFAKISFSFN